MDQPNRRRDVPKSGWLLNLDWIRKDGGYLDLDCRIWFVTNYYSISPGMISQIPGKGAKYMIGFTDSDGTALSGGTNYKSICRRIFPLGISGR